MARRNRSRTQRRLGALLLVAGLATACSGGLGAASGQPAGASGLGKPSATTEPDMSWSEAWAAIDGLIDEQKNQAAVDACRELREQARQAGDAAQWTRALIREVQLTTALGGVETALRLLEETPWPDGPTEQAALRLLRAHALERYLETYGWEIAQRERVGPTDAVDLRQWTRAQIVSEVDRAFSELWVERRDWGERPLAELAEYVDGNQYPARIRGTLRDVVTHLWVEFLANTGYWEPAASNNTYRLDFERLAGPKTIESDPGAHPLVRLTALLSDLEGWHRAGDRPEAALDALLSRLEKLESHASGAGERSTLRERLQSGLDGLGKSYPWWSVGQAQLARLVQAEGRWMGLAEARDLAREGERAHPDTIGGRRCRSLAASLEAPAFDIEAMRTDGPGRRSIAVGHKNLERLYFRAYALDLATELTASRDYNLLPSHRRVEGLIADGTAAFAWESELPATPDLRQHRTFVVPPMQEPGLYVIVASAAPHFRPEGNRLQGLDFIVSDLVVAATSLAGDVEVAVRSGSIGSAIAGAEVELWKLDYRGGHQRSQRATTDAAGSVSLAAPGRRTDAVVIARSDSDVTFTRLQVGRAAQRAPRDSDNALVYTDRSVYRPGQEVLWKAVAYRRYEAERRHRVQPEARLTVELVDANWEVVASAEVEANEYGSASGAFTIPAGRLLGSWQLRTSAGGTAAIEVEEYKRPTFEVTLADPPEALRLNREATLAGEARYYFGLPVVEGEVRWRVARRPRYPDWWGWRSSRPQGEEEVIASGDATLGAEGGFTVSFRPEADETQAAQGVSYSFALTVEVTDAGGETRSAERTFRLGFVAVETILTASQGFFRPGDTARFSAVRSDLDGSGRAGAADWRLLALEAPARPLLPADEPVQLAEEQAVITPGDRQRARWEGRYDVASRLRSWSDGAELMAGSLVHDAAGEAGIELPELGPGGYRLRYSTSDPFRAVFETQLEFVVAGATELPLPALLEVERTTAEVGSVARILVHSGLEGQEMKLEIARPEGPIEVRRLRAAKNPVVIEVAVAEEDRGDIRLRLRVVRDHQVMELGRQILVPAPSSDLDIRFSSFRDLLRPGSRERWRVVVSGVDEQRLAAGSAEVLTYMYDRALDLFAPHQPPRPTGFRLETTALPGWVTSLGRSNPVLRKEVDWYEVHPFPYLQPDRIKFFDDYGIGGPGRSMALQRGGPMMMRSMSPQAAQESMEVQATQDAALGYLDGGDESVPPAKVAPPDSPPGDGGDLRTNFSETAFWEPHLILDSEGGVAFEFTVPDSVTEWNVWVHALTRDLRAGALETRVRTVKELLVRPYLPRFLREGDVAELKVVVQNAGERALDGTLALDILDPETDASLGEDFGLEASSSHDLPFAVEPGGSATLTIPVTAPRRVGSVAVRVEGAAGDLSDGELRPLPLLPGRYHLTQSRFAALEDRARRELTFEDLAADADPTRIDQQMVVTLDGQLFYSVLGALPYLVDYPYECTEQTLNRFLSTGIVSSVFDDYPAVALMATKLAERDTPLESWPADDPNRRMALEETPWLQAAAGGSAPQEGLLKVLDPRVAAAQRRASIAKLEDSQTALGGFPWWPGGPPSPYMTLYVVSGLSRAAEFGIEVPQAMVVRAWGYLHRHYLDELVRELEREDGRPETITYLNYVLSNFPDPAWTGDLFSAEDRQRMLEHSFRHWRRHSPLLKGYLALTLVRAGRQDDAKLVFDSVMDSAKTTEDQGTFWAPEARAWLWYNDTIETHAFALRVLSELDSEDPRRQGLVHWLMLNKKLNHWKSTRATAEVIYSLVHYLASAGELGVREEATVAWAGTTRDFAFEPDEYTGRNQQWLVEGSEVAADHATVTLEKETPGLMFASATWHYSTEILPESARSDFFAVERSYFRRVRGDDGWRLEALDAGATLAPGDQVEVHVSLAARHAAEYVHLRDPRAAGLEPEALSSGYRWDLGIGWYEQVRDSGTDFFFESLPAGEYTFKYRLRANLAGTFKAGPATVQSMYAPEFNAFSSGATLSIGR